MKRKMTSMLFAAPLLVLFLGACSQDSAPPASDTAVHDAEVAAAGTDDLMAKGEGVYLANCAACHQPTGVGLKGAFYRFRKNNFLDWHMGVSLTQTKKNRHC